MAANLPSDRAFDALRRLRGPGHEPHIEKILRERLAIQGRLTFAEFMDLALYHPEYGYYQSERAKFGPAGDFLTAPEVHPIFGQLIAQQLAESWKRLGRPSPYTIVEMGGGTGVLARQILTTIRKDQADLLPAVNYALIEKSQSLRRLQQDRLDSIDRPRVHWHQNFPGTPFVGAVIANEFVDALPVHRVVVERGRLLEVYVVAIGDGFAEIVDEPSSGAIADYFEQIGIWPAEGTQAEVNLAALDWLEDIHQHLERGHVLVVDYGSEAYDLLTRPTGTIRAFHQHTVSGNLLRRIGLQDITANVNFTALKAHALAVGFEIETDTTQRDFLLRLGAAQNLECLAGEPTVDTARQRAALEYLLDPDGMGGFRVLMLAKR